MNFQDVLMKLYPMKAKGVQADKIPWEDKNYIFEEKFDGDRRLFWITKNGNFNTSRNKSKKTNLPTDKTDNVPHLRDIMLYDLEGTILDGEFIHQKGFEYVRRIMGALPEKSIETQEEYGYIKFIVYDIISYKGTFLNDEPLWRRKEILDGIFNKYNIAEKSNYYISLVQSYTGGNKEYLESLFDEIIKNGGEGLVAKNLNSTYRLSTEKCMTCLKLDWIKIKKGYVGDFVIMDFEEPTKKYDGKTELSEWPYWLDETNNKIISLHEMAIEPGKEAIEFYGYTPVTKYYAMNWIGAIKFGEYRDGKLVEVGTVSSGLDESTRQWFSNNKDKLIGSVIEISAMERDKKSLALRHPVYVRLRDDKEANECIYENQKG